MPEVLSVVLALLPGFLGMLIYSYLARGRERDAIDKIVIALSLTLLSSLGARVLVWALGLPEFSVASEALRKSAEPLAAASPQLVYPTLVSIVLAVFFAIANNRDWIYPLLRRYGLTYQSGQQHVFDDIFLSGRPLWARLHCKDGRRLVGTARRASNLDGERELYLKNARWFTPDPAAPGGFVETDVNWSGVYVPSMDDVGAIEIFAKEPP